MGSGGPGSSSTSGKVECLVGREGSLGGRDGRDGSAGGSRNVEDGDGNGERDGSRGGPWGKAGGADRFGSLSSCCCASSLAFASISRRVGGSGGSLAWSKAGGSFLVGWALSDVTLVRADEEAVLFQEDVDTLERYEMSDELEFLRPPGTGREVEVDRRGGRTGELSCVEFRDGNGGGGGFLVKVGIGLSSGMSCSVVRRGKGGGLTTAEAARVGRGGSDGVGVLSF